MISFFERLPGLVIQLGHWAMASPLTCLLLGVLILAAGFIALTASYQRRTRRNDRRRAERQGKPGAFPGDNR
jgi:hypothetical protein